jgi:hypothetical protein
MSDGQGTEIDREPLDLLLANAVNISLVDKSPFFPFVSNEWWLAGNNEQ